MSTTIDKYEEYLAKTRIPLRLSCTTESGWPFVLSLWYMYRGGFLYSATKNTAKVVGYLSSNPQCAFEIASDFPPYCGLRGQAIAEINPDLGPDILMALIDRYLGDRNNPLAIRLLKDLDSEVALVLRPVNLFKWNFSSRMEGISTTMIDLHVKTCP
jgi:hypothetical protein